MGKNRDSLSIIADILEVTSSGASKTRIMFRANLSYKLLEKYLTAVVKAGFVRHEGFSYVLTDVGQKFLNEYRAFRKVHVQAEKMLENLSCERDRLFRLCKSS